MGGDYHDTEMVCYSVVGICDDIVKDMDNCD